MSYLSDDITFCPLDCERTDCMRNSKNIIDRTIPHSYSVEIPEDCLKRFVSWEKYQANRMIEYDYGTYEHTNIACPDCGNQLMRRTDLVLTSFPQKYHYKCCKCEWTGIGY